MHRFHSSSRPHAALHDGSVRKALPSACPLLLLALLALWHKALLPGRIHIYEAAAENAVNMNGDDAESLSALKETPVQLQDDASISQEEDDEYLADATSFETDDYVTAEPPRLRGVAEIHASSVDAAASSQFAPVPSPSAQAALHIDPQIVADGGNIPAQDYVPNSSSSIQQVSAPARAAKEVKLKPIEIPHLHSPQPFKNQSPTLTSSLPSTAGSPFPQLDSTGRSVPRFTFTDASPTALKSPLSAAPQRSLPSVFSTANSLVNPLDMLHTLSRGVNSLPTNMLTNLPDLSSVLHPQGRGFHALPGLETPSATEEATEPTTPGTPVEGIGGNLSSVLHLPKTALHSMLPPSVTLAEDSGIKQALAAATGLVGRGSALLPHVGGADANLLSTAGDMHLFDNTHNVLAGDGRFLENAQQVLNMGVLPQPPLAPRLGDTPLIPGIPNPPTSTLLGDGSVLAPVLEGKIVGEGGLIDPSALGYKLLGNGSLLNFDRKPSDSAHVDDHPAGEPKPLADANLFGVGLPHVKLLTDKKIIGEGGLLDPKVLHDMKIVPEGGLLDPKRLGEAANTLLDPKTIAEKVLGGITLPGDIPPSNEGYESPPASPVSQGDDEVAPPATSEDPSLLGGLLGNNLGSMAALDPKLSKDLALLDPKVVSALLGAIGSGDPVLIDYGALDPTLVENLRKLDPRMLEDSKLLNPEFLQKLRLIDPKLLDLLQSFKIANEEVLRNLQSMDPKFLESLRLVDPNLFENLRLIDPALFAKLTDPATLSTLNLSEYTPAEVSGLVSYILENIGQGKSAGDLASHLSHLLPADGPLASLLQRNSSGSELPDFTPPPSLQVDSPTLRETAPQQGGAPRLAKFFNRGRGRSQM